MIRSQRGPKGAPRRRKGGTSEHDRGYKLLFLVFSVLFYHGKPPWSPSLDLARLFGPAPEEVKDHLPHLRYRLLEVSRLPLHEPALRGNLVAALLRLEIAEARGSGRPGPGARPPHFL